MSHEMNLTDNQWYNFICGMQAGLKLKDLTLPAYDTNIVLTPIGVGGYGQIGIAISEVLYDGTTNNLLVPVFTHDVDIDYSGFSCNITWDTNRLQVLELKDGDFGEVGTYINYNINNGVCLVRGLRESSKKFNEPIILFYLSVKVLDTNITKDNPIPINLISGTGYDPNYTTLLKYVLNGIDNKYYLYYITPIKNISGAIISEKEPVKEPISDSKDISASGSISGVFVGTATTYPGEIGVVPIVSNSSVEDNFLYNRVHTKITIVDGSSVFGLIDVIAVPGWTITKTISTDEHNNLVLDIIADRKEANIDSITFGYIAYNIAYTENDYIVYLNNIESELINTETLEVLEVYKGSGRILYFTVGASGASDGDGPGTLGSTGGVSGGGKVWSSGSGIMWVSVNNAPKYPVYLKPGWNDIYFWIPFIFPEDEWVEAEIIIETPGYILIPAGFEFNISTSENAPVKLVNPRLSDKLKFVDFYDYDLISAPVPVNVDNIIDEVVFEDTHSVDIIGITNIIKESNVDEIVFEDTHSIDFEADFKGEYTNIEEIKAEDYTEFNLVSRTIINNDNIDELEFTDIKQEDIINTNINTNNEEESLSFNDFTNIEIN